MGAEVAVVMDSLSAKVATESTTCAFHLVASVTLQKLLRATGARAFYRLRHQLMRTVNWVS